MKKQLLYISRDLEDICIGDILTFAKTHFVLQEIIKFEDGTVHVNGVTTEKSPQAMRHIPFEKCKVKWKKTFPSISANDRKTNVSKDITTFHAEHGPISIGSLAVVMRSDITNSPKVGTKIIVSKLVYDGKDTIIHGRNYSGANWAYTILARYCDLHRDDPAWTIQPYTNRSEIPETGATLFQKMSKLAKEDLMAKLPPKDYKLIADENREIPRKLIDFKDDHGRIVVRSGAPHMILAPSVYKAPPGDEPAPEHQVPIVNLITGSMWFADGSDAVWPVKDQKLTFTTMRTGE